MKVNKQQDEAARSIEFGVEIETIIPVGSEISVGGYHAGLPVTEGLSTNDRLVHAPAFAGKTWRADRDGSIGIKSVIGSGTAPAIAEFVRKLAHVGQRHAWAIYAQTGTDRHQNHYAAQLRLETGSHVAEMTRTEDTIRLSTLAAQCGRGMINFSKAFRGDAGCVEFRAFAGTLNEAKILHHVATSFGIVRRASQVRAIGRFDRKSTKKHTNVKSAVEALKKMWRSLGWRDAAAGRDCALGLFGSLHAEFGQYSKTALRMAGFFETKFPNANL